MSDSTPAAAVLANCTHASLAKALSKSGCFSSVRSVEVYTVPEEAREKEAETLSEVDFILTLEHGEGFGPLSTASLRERFGGRVFALPTPFFSGLMPDMAYLTVAGEISRAPGVLGDYHSALILRECQDGRSEEEVATRYADGTAFERLDVEGVWNDGIEELKRREKNTEISLSDFLMERKAVGLLTEEFLSFNHPREGLINHIAQTFLTLAIGPSAKAEPLMPSEHNLYHDARWPLHPAVAQRLGLPLPRTQTFRSPNRLGGEEMTLSEFALRSARFILSENSPQDFEIHTPWFLKNRLR